MSLCPIIMCNLLDIFKICSDNVIFKKIMTFFNFKTCFDVANIIVSCKIFERTGFYIFCHLPLFVISNDACKCCCTSFKNFFTCCAHKKGEQCSINFWCSLLSFQNDLRSNDLPSRPPVHAGNHAHSPPSKDTNSRIVNGGNSRNPLSSFPIHSSVPTMKDPVVDPDYYSSVYSSNNPLGRRSPIRNHESVLSTIPSSISFVDDSLEVGVPRSSWSEPVLTTALGPRPATVNSSGNFIAFYSQSAYCIKFKRNFSMFHYWV